MKLVTTNIISTLFRIFSDSGKHGMTEPSAEQSAELFSNTSEMVPSGLNIPMYESWRIRSDIFPVTRFFGKHRILDGIPRNFFKSLKTDSKRLQMVQAYPSMT